MSRIDKIKVFASGFFGGGSLYGFGALIMGGLALWWAFADHYYDKGIADCEMAQGKADEQVEDLTDTVLVDDAAIDDDFKTEKTDAETTLQAELDAADLNQAYRDGFNAALASRQTAAVDEARDDGGCLSVPYASDDVLLISARSLQRSLSQGGTDGDGTGSTGTVRATADAERLSGPPPGLYPGPD